MCDLAEIAARAKATGSEHRLDDPRWDMPDIGPAGIELLDLLLVDIEPDQREAMIRNGAAEGQSHIAHAANSDGGSLLADFSM